MNRREWLVLRYTLGVALLTALLCAGFAAILADRVFPNGMRTQTVGFALHGLATLAALWVWDVGGYLTEVVRYPWRELYKSGDVGVSREAFDTTRRRLYAEHRVEHFYGVLGGCPWCFPPPAVRSVEERA